MGTNYYLHIDPCETCGHPKEKLHIGKSSGGWCFSLHVMPEENINTLEDWRARFNDGVIINEYDEVLTPEAMLDIITDRWIDDPLRHVIGEGGCIGHGDGTWDYITGAFL